MGSHSMHHMNHIQPKHTCTPSLSCCSHTTHRKEALMVKRAAMVEKDWKVVRAEAAARAEGVVMEAVALALASSILRIQLHAEYYRQPRPQPRHIAAWKYHRS